MANPCFISYKIVTFALFYEKVPSLVIIIVEN